jgi:WD40 repeat protein
MYVSNDLFLINQEFTPSGRSFVTGSNSGSITLWKLKEDLSLKESTLFKMQDKKGHTSAIDCIKFVDNRMVSKSLDGKIFVTDLSTGKVQIEIDYSNVTFLGYY